MVQQTKQRMFFYPESLVSIRSGPCTDSDRKIHMGAASIRSGPHRFEMGSFTWVQSAYGVGPTQDSDGMITWVQQGQDVRKHARVTMWTRNRGCGGLNKMWMINFYCDSNLYFLYLIDLVILIELLTSQWS